MVKGIATMEKSTVVLQKANTNKPKPRKPKKDKVDLLCSSTILFITHLKEEKAESEKGICTLS